MSNLRIYENDQVELDVKIEDDQGYELWEYLAKNLKQGKIVTLASDNQVLSWETVFDYPIPF